MTVELQHECQPSAKDSTVCRRCRGKLSTPEALFIKRLVGWVERRKVLEPLTKEQAALVDDLFADLGVSR